jgi:hypothetical protein
MNHINTQNFEHSILEQDIERLSKIIAEAKKFPESKDFNEKELIKKSLEKIMAQVNSGEPAITQHNVTLTQNVTLAQKILPDYLENEEPEIKLTIEKLIDEVFHEGLDKTIKKASQAGPFFLDAFHDALADKLFDELKKRKLI